MSVTIRQSLSSLPLTVVDPKEYKDVQDVISDSINKMRESGDFVSIKKHGKELTAVVEDHDRVLVTIDMVNQTFAVDTNPHERCKRWNKMMDCRTKFYTWDEILAKISEWKAKGFKPLKSSDNKKCLNSLFEITRVFKTSKGYLWGNMMDISYPEEALEKYVIF